MPLVGLASSCQDCPRVRLESEYLHFRSEYFDCKRETARRSTYPNVCHVFVDRDLTPASLTIAPLHPSLPMRAPVGLYGSVLFRNAIAKVNFYVKRKGRFPHH